MASPESNYIIPDAEKLKEVYNRNYSTSFEHWSVTSLPVAQRIVKRLIREMKRAPSNQKQSTLLDVGCAAGVFTEAWRSSGFSALGIDYSDVAIAQAQKQFLQNTFLCMNGMAPSLDRKFDIIFMRHFSGISSRDLRYVSSLLNQYVSLLNEDGFLIVAFPTNFSGEETENEMVNWTKQEIAEIVSSLSARLHRQFYAEETWRFKIHLLLNPKLKVKRSVYLLLSQTSY